MIRKLIIVKAARVSKASAQVFKLAINARAILDSRVNNVKPW